MKTSKYLLTLAFCLAAFSAVACSDDSSSSTAADDGKKDAATWDDLQVFDAKVDLPSCEKFEGVAAQVIDEKAFFACVDGEWTQIAVSAPTYDELPKCNAPMNDFCIDVGDGEEPEASYICDEGTWVKGVDGSCLKGDDNLQHRNKLSNDGVDKGDDNYGFTGDAPKKGVDLQVFDGKADLPSCDKFDGVAQVIDEKAFFACLEGEWTQIAMFARAYDELPKCNAPMNDFCIDVGEGEEPEAAYICDEGTWVKGVDGSCLKGDDNNFKPIAKEKPKPS